MQNHRINICAKCVHYVQHYVFSEGKYYWAYLGHCMQPGLKPCRPHAKACKHFKEKLRPQGDVLK